MAKNYGRRELLKGAAAAWTAALVPPARSLENHAQAAGTPLRVAGQEAEVQISAISRHAIRISILEVRDGHAVSPLENGALTAAVSGEPVARLRGSFGEQSIRAGKFLIAISRDPLRFAISTGAGKIQEISADSATGAISFATPGTSPLLGLGEGGPQFDRRGNLDPMRNGQGGYRLATHGSRVPIPWIIGTGGSGQPHWALFINQPFGAFDFTSEPARFLPRRQQGANAAASAGIASEGGAAGEPLPRDLFLVSAEDPADIMAEYARLTGHPELPPLWSLGYQQSHRTLASREEVLGVANTFREKRLPCDALIYLGTGFCPSGWNTANGSFDWNRRVFDDPPAIIKELHGQNFRVALHAVILADKLEGTAGQPCALSAFDDARASCYWDEHRRDFAMGVDGWWPDEGDWLDIASRLNRNRMYWDGPRLDRANERPYALHRNGYAGMQRYASFLWSGDVQSTWETLKTHVPTAVNTALSGIPYWGTDIGGFVPTPEFTAELYLRWFQFGAFCTLFRAHGRTWKLRLPWQWNTGDPGPIEINRYGGAATPDASQLHNPQVEVICRKYLELRYRMLPYLYSAVREGAQTGMPVMRALWLQYPDDPQAVARGDEYLWGPSILVAPVTEKGAASKQVYLPRGDWFDFWTGDRVTGGREIARPVDLETLPLYVREGSIVPFGPVKQYTGEKVDAPLTITVFPGADGSFLLYEDDGTSFNHRRGEWMGIRLAWDDAKSELSLRLAEGSRMLPPAKREIEVKLGQSSKQIEFEGRPVSLTLQTR